MRLGPRDDLDAAVGLRVEHLVHPRQRPSSDTRCVITNDGSICAALRRGRAVGARSDEVRLAHPERQALAERGADRELVDEAAVDAGDRDRAALAARQDRLRAARSAGRSRGASACFARSYAYWTPAPCASMPTASMHASGPRPPVSSSSRCEHVAVCSSSVIRAGLGAPSAGAREPSRSRSRARRRAGARCGSRTARPDRSPEHRDRVARLDVAVLRGHVAGREDVGEEQRLLVGRARSGIFRQPTSANGTRTYSAWPPA